MLRKVAAAGATLALVLACGLAFAEHEGDSGPIAAALAGSAHATLSCSSCHSEHGGSPAGACGRCHDAEASAAAGDAHARAAAFGDQDEGRCVSCHGSHTIGRRAEQGARTSPANGARLCGGCHPAQFQAFAADPHGAALFARSLGGAPSCASCHRAHGVEPASAPASAIAIASVERTCGACHGRAAGDFGQSVHAAAVGAGVRHAPSCSTCHGEHPLRSRVDVNAACGQCHGKLPIAEHQIRTTVTLDYQGSYHGLAGRLGDRRVANCASCHGAHDVLRATDPRSTVHPANLAATCGRCHAGAGDRFARGGIHHPGRGAGHKAVDVAAMMYRFMMIPLVLGFMAAHNAPDFARRWIDRRRRKPRPAGAPGDKSISRFTVFERVQHWVLAASFITLALTGFALRFSWRPPLGDPQTWAVTRAALHRIGAVVFLGVAAVHAVYLFGTRRGRGFLREIGPRFARLRDCICALCACMRLGPPTTSDWRDLVATFRYNLGRAAAPPRMGRFTYAEKMEYLALVWGSLVMSATGLLLWAFVPLLNRLPFWAAELATTVHYYEGVLAALSILVWHFYFTIYNPDVFPLAPQMITGRVSREEMERDHGGELDRMGAKGGEAGHR